MLQDRAGRVRARASVTDVLAVMQRGEGLIERFDQAGQRIPLHRCPSRDAPVAPQPDRTQRGQRRGLAVEQHNSAIPPSIPSRMPRRPARVRAGRPWRRDGGHAGASCSMPGPVSMPMRHAWICTMEEFSFADNSRPDRWMYCSVESVLRCPANVAIVCSSQVLVPLLVADLVDPNPSQSGEPIVGGVDVGPDPGNDRSHCAPGDPHQRRHRGLRGLGGQPGNLIIEGVGVARVVTGPGHRRDHDPMSPAPNAGCIGLEVCPDRPQIHCPPVTSARPGVITRAATTTDPAPATLALHRSDVQDQQLRVLVELDPLDYRLLDTQQAPP